jgi:hypothetical protein
MAVVDLIFGADHQQGIQDLLPRCIFVLVQYSCMEATGNKTKDTMVEKKNRDKRYLRHYQGCISSMRCNRDYDSNKTTQQTSKS